MRDLQLKLLLVSGSDKAVVVAEKHAVNSNSMSPPFPAGTELAMFGEAPLLHVDFHSCYIVSAFCNCILVCVTWQTSVSEFVDRHLRRVMLKVS